MPNKSLTELLTGLAQVRELVEALAKPGADAKAITAKLASTLSSYDKEEVQGFGRIIAGKQTHLPGYPDSVVMIERK